MRHTTITARDLECLEHMRNVGQLVGDLMQVQDCATVPRDPAQHLQLTSVIYLMTAQARRRGRTLQSALADRGEQRMKKPLPPVLRAALYRRAVACAWLTLCERQHRYPHLTLDALESAIAAEPRRVLSAPARRGKRPPDCLCTAGRFNGSRTTQSRAVAVLSRAGRDG